MTIKEILEILEAEIITGSEYLDMEIKIGCASDLMSDVLAFAKPDSILLTGLVNPQVVHTLDMADIKVVCFVRGKKPGEKMISMAKMLDIVVLITTLPMFESSGRLYKKGLPGLGYLDINKRDG